MLKSHIMMAFGLLLAMVYAVRLAAGFSLSDGINAGEAYLLGGLALAGALMFSGLRERRRARAAKR